MDLGQLLLSIVDVDGSGWTVEKTLNCWGQEISIDGNQLCIRKSKHCGGQWRTCFNTQLARILGQIVKS
uniref:Uncharacterized protein n=1 Tax=Brassica oleracea TaxID=3712 RepID=A0A3P6C2A9_BRAOL|nr:unnamed protein product [Brassica oleracea]